MTYISEVPLSTIDHGVYLHAIPVGYGLQGFMGTYLMREQLSLS